MQLLGYADSIYMLRNCGLSFLLKFAENACGVVQAVLNGSHNNTFDKNRYWGEGERRGGRGDGGISGDGKEHRPLFLCIVFARVSSAP